jgi:hypothetical protein
MRQRRIQQTRTLIIENLPLEMGLRAKDIVGFLLKKLKDIGEYNDVHIVDVDLNPFSNKNHANSISV